MPNNISKQKLPAISQDDMLQKKKKKKKLPIVSYGLMSHIISEYEKSEKNKNKKFLARNRSHIGTNL